ncbi:MAG: hypothetical protein ACI3W5_12695 [Faecousia sp.]
MSNNRKDEIKNYELSSEAVDTLANADKEEIPQYSEEELSKYRKKKFHIPDWLKVIFMKFWFAGAICFFIVFGTGATHLLDLYVALSIILGMVTDLLTNNVVRFIEPYEGANSKYLLVTHRGMVGFGLNLLLGFVTIGLVMGCYFLLNLFVPIGVEPLLFGLLCMGAEMLLIGIKHLCSSILNDAKAAALGDSKNATNE